MNEAKRANDGGTNDMTNKAGRGKWIVSPEWLHERLDDPNVVVLDASWVLPEEAAPGTDVHEEFLEEHIPGAQFFDIDEVADPNAPLPHTAPPPELFAEKVGRMGISNDTTVIIYDTFPPFAAPRAWWLFRLFGHDDVAVLDGGLEAWSMAGYDVEEGPAKPREARTFTPNFRRELIAYAEDVKKALEEGLPQVVDARSPGRFSCTEPEPYEGVPSGHMPGAKNAYYARFMNVDGTLKAPDELRHEFEQAEVDLDKPIIFTCGSGVTACLPALAAAELGHEQWSVYDGSWREWSALPDVPKVLAESALG